MYLAIMYLEIHTIYILYVYVYARVCVRHFVTSCFYATKVRAVATEQKIYQRKLEFIVLQRCSV